MIYKTSLMLTVSLLSISCAMAASTVVMPNEDPFASQRLGAQGALSKSLCDDVMSKLQTALKPLRDSGKDRTLLDSEVKALLTFSGPSTDRAEALAALWKQKLPVLRGATNRTDGTDSIRERLNQCGKQRWQGPSEGVERTVKRTFDATTMPLFQDALRDFRSWIWQDLSAAALPTTTLAADDAPVAPAPFARPPTPPSDAADDSAVAPSAAASAPIVFPSITEKNVQAWADELVAPLQEAGRRIIGIISRNQDTEWPTMTDDDASKVVDASGVFSLQNLRELHVGKGWGDSTPSADPAKVARREQLARILAVAHAVGVSTSPLSDIQVRALTTLIGAYGPMCGSKTSLFSRTGNVVTISASPESSKAYGLFPGGHTTLEYDASAKTLSFKTPAEAAAGGMMAALGSATTAVASWLRPTPPPAS